MKLNGITMYVDFIVKKASKKLYPLRILKM